MTTSLMNEQVTELVAIGAAIGSNCEPCLRYHHRRAIGLGVEASDLRAAVLLAQQVKDTPAKLMLDLADKLIGLAEEPAAVEAAPQPCRGGAAAASPSGGEAAGGCC